jgi:hypothetical protein
MNQPSALCAIRMTTTNVVEASVGVNLAVLAPGSAACIERRRSHDAYRLADGCGFSQHIC